MTSERAADRASVSRGAEPADQQAPDQADEPATDRADQHAEDPDRVEERVHVDLPRVRPEDMVTPHDVDPPADPEGGRDTDRDFVIRYGGGGI